MIIETKGTNSYANYFYSKGTLAFYNTVFRNFYNLDYTDFLTYYEGNMYFYNVTVDKTASNNLFIRRSSNTGALVIQNVYGKITLDNSCSTQKIDINVLKDSLIVKTAQLDENYNIIEEGWINSGLGENPDGSKAHIGVYGGPNAWK